MISRVPGSGRETNGSLREKPVNGRVLIGKRGNGNMRTTRPRLADRRLPMSRTGLCIFVIFSVLATSSSGPAQTGPPGDYNSVQANGISLAYRVLCEGEPLLLLHGFAGTGDRWNWCIDEFSREYRLIVPDHRGHGRSTNPTGEFTNHQAALDAFALLDSLGIETFKGMGVSTGAMVLLHMATIDPERVEAMVLVSGTLYYPEQARAIYRSYAPENLPPGAFEAVGRVHARGAEQARELAEQFYAFKDSYEDMSFTPPHLATITAQTLIVHGDRDEYFPVEMAFEQYHAIPNSYLWVFPNAGHPPYVGSDHGLAIFSETAREFLRGEWWER